MIETACTSPLPSSAAYAAAEGEVIAHNRATPKIAYFIPHPHGCPLSVRSGDPRRDAGQWASGAGTRPFPLEGSSVSTAPHPIFRYPACVLNCEIMRTRLLAGSVESIRRKLRALAAIVDDFASTDHEKANAQALEARLLQRLREAGSPAGDWTDRAFRLGRRAQEMRKATAPALPKGDWTDNAFRLGKAVRRGYKKWLSE